MAADSKDDKQPKDEPVVHDKRKIDPATGEARAEAQPERGEGAGDGDLTDLSDDDLALLADAERDLVAEYRERAARAEAELKNFRTRVERDRQANREAVIAEVIRSLLPTIDDLDRAETHGDLVEGSPLAIVAQKLRAGFDRYGLKRVGETGDPFDPKLHEAIAQVYSKDVTAETVADVIEPGYALGERLLRPARVAVSVPEPSAPES
jgi:molecular chaperone GrpE